MPNNEPRLGQLAVQARAHEVFVIRQPVLEDCSLDDSTFFKYISSRIAERARNARRGLRMKEDVCFAVGTSRTILSQHIPPFGG